MGDVLVTQGLYGDSGNAVSSTSLTGISGHHMNPSIISRP